MWGPHTFFSPFSSSFYFSSSLFFFLLSFCSSLCHRGAAASSEQASKRAVASGVERGGGGGGRARDWWSGADGGEWLEQTEEKVDPPTPVVRRHSAAPLHCTSRALACRCWRSAPPAVTRSPVYSGQSPPPAAAQLDGGGRRRAGEPRAPRRQRSSPPPKLHPPPRPKSPSCRSQPLRLCVCPLTLVATIANAIEKSGATSWWDDGRRRAVTMTVPIEGVVVASPFIGAPAEPSPQVAMPSSFCISLHCCFLRNFNKVDVKILCYSLAYTYSRITLFKAMFSS